MIPLRDINPTHSKPVLTYGLIAANVFVFLSTWSTTPSEFQIYIYKYGVVPYELVYGTHLGSISTLFSSMFMHGGWLHLIFNMWFLYIFGDNLEDRLGRLKYILFYILCGLAAAAAQVLIDPTSKVPMVGASGAIAGVLGGYVRLFPRARVVTLIPFFILLLVREIPAVVFIVIWFVFQLLSGIGSLGSIGDQTGGVAFFAHIGGFIAGVLLIHRFSPPRNRTYGWSGRRGRSSSGSGYWS